MHNTQEPANRDFVIRKGALRNLYGVYGEGTGSLIDEERSAPFQGVPRLWEMLNPTVQCFLEGQSATTGIYIFITKNQIDYSETPAALEPNPEVKQATPSIVLSPASVLERVRAVFGLNISETAEIFGITRQTVYKWMSLNDMEQVRSHKYRDRIKKLYGAAQSWEMNPQLKGRWLHALLPTGNTVIDILKASTVDLEALQAAYQALFASTADRRIEEGERATQAVTALAGAFAGIGAGRKTR